MAEDATDSAPRATASTSSAAVLIGAGIGAALGGPLGALVGGKLGGTCAAGAATGAALVSLSRRATQTSTTVYEGGGVKVTRECDGGGACVEDTTADTTTTLPALPPLPTADSVSPPNPSDSLPQTGGLRGWLGRALAPTTPPPDGALPPLPPLPAVATTGGGHATSSMLPSLPSLRLAKGWLTRGGGDAPPCPPPPPRGQGDAYFRIPPP